MSRPVWRDSAVEYQADEQAGVTRLRWRVSSASVFSDCGGIVFLFIFVFISGYAVFPAARLSSSCGEGRLRSSCRAGFSLRRLPLGSTGSGAQAL